MARDEIYPWSTLRNVGDYFIVETKVRPYSYVSQLVSQRNYRVKSQKLSYTKTDYGTIVMLAEIPGEYPPIGYEYTLGVYTGPIMERVFEVEKEAEAPGARPLPRVLTMKERVARMSVEEKNANLPWWYDPKNNQLLVNTRLIKEPESTMWMEKRFTPNVNDPYPEHYNLDDDLKIKRDEEQEDEEEDWGDTGLFPPGEDE